MAHRLASPLVALAAMLLLVTALAATVLRAAPAHPALADAPLSAPGEWFDSQRAVGADLSHSAYGDALAQAANAETIDAEWELLGPTNIGGRVNDLALDPDDPAVLYAAAASGGVWRSADGGTTFAPSWPADLTQAIGAMTNAPDGTLYVGTGEANPGGGSIVFGGTGIYRSRDEGATWDHVGLPTSGAFGRIAVHPTDSNIVYAAAAGNLFVPGGERGLYRSTDGGNTWQLVLAGDNATTGAVDVAIDPENPNHLLAAMWDHYRDPDKRVYAGPGSSVHESHDGGTTWRRATEITMPDPQENGRIGVAFAPGDSSRAYAIIANTLDGTHGAWFRSDDGGTTWSQLPDHGTLVASNSSYGWWFARIWVDPADADRLFVAGLELIESTDGGESFVAHSSTTAGVLTGAHQVLVHADQHAMVWHPDVPGLVYLGNDGGVYRSPANATAGTWVAAVQQGWTQHYSVDVSESHPDYVVSGLQDNLCQRTVTDPVTGGDMSWSKYGLCGDGLETLVHPSDPSVTYGCSQYGGCGRQVGGVPDVRFRMPSGERYGWFADLEMDPSNASVLYTGGSQVHRSVNGGNSWTAISEDLSGDPDQQDPNPGYRLRGVVTSIGVGPGETLWAGTDNGRLWRTADLGGEWTEITSAVLPEGRWITRVTVDQANPGTAYVTYSGFRSGDHEPGVFRTTDDGATWTDISGNLPDAPVNDVVLTAGGLAVGTDVGVFVTSDGGVIWQRLGDLPTVPVLDLRWHEASSTLYAATFGHGIQRVTVPTASPTTPLPATVVLGG